MATHWARLLVVLACICIGILGAASVAATPYLPPSGLATTGQDQDGMLPGGDVPATSPGDATVGQDQDGMLPGGQTPDDDGDGVADADDSAPDDPNAGEAPAPGPTDPVADNDNDGLPNVMDPDDNDNGRPDAEEGVGTVDDVPPATGPVTNSPEPVVDVPVAEGYAPSETRPLVLSLPSTGTGVEAAPRSLPLLLIASAILLAASGISLRSRRL